ncbi:hypothetical protein BDZ89DRAFT_614100 [Hymenopellis radicata]|nr:hypothetical protein BDZ89DRAFT_614100 [Hymenopellis radicata]
MSSAFPNILSVSSLSLQSLMTSNVKADSLLHQLPLSMAVDTSLQLVLVCLIVTLSPRMQLDLTIDFTFITTDTTPDVSVPPRPSQYPCYTSHGSPHFCIWYAC